MSPAAGRLARALADRYTPERKLGQGRIECRYVGRMAGGTA